MRIGVVPDLDRGTGGAYQYAVTLLDALPEVVCSEDEIVVFVRGGEHMPPELADRFTVVPLRALSGVSGRAWYALAGLLPSSVRQAITAVFRHRRGQVPLSESGARESEVDSHWQSFFRQHAVDLLIFTSDSDLPYRTGIPFVVAVHDIQHRLQPEFLETSADGEWERREGRIGPCVRNARIVLVDSEVGKEDVLNHYADLGVDASKVFVLPFLPAAYLECGPRSASPRAARDYYGLPDDFLFYPAAFWPHKNHRRIVEALALLREGGLSIPLVLSGPKGGLAIREETFADVMSTAKRLGVDDLVVYLGYVEDPMMAALYAEATALVMPTFFGPTNIPVVEAFKFGLPVVTSDIRGIREQVGDAALLVDPTSVPAIADAIRRIATDEDLRRRLIRGGHAHIESYTRDDYVASLKVAINAARESAGAVACTGADGSRTAEERIPQ